MSYIEFIGGPYDGHREGLGAAPPSEELAWVVCRDIFQLFKEIRHKGLGTITSVAIYQLEAAKGHFRYRFLRGISFDELTNDVPLRRAMT